MAMNPVRLLKLNLIFLAGAAFLLISLDLRAEDKKSDVGKKPVISLSDKEMRGIQEKLKSFQYLSVDFTQSTFRSLRKRTTVTTGKAHFSKPDKFRWMLIKPKADQWIFDGKTLSQYIPDRKEAVSYGSGANKGKEFRQIVDLVLNFNNLLERFTIKSSKKIDHFAEIVLEPKKKGGDIAEAVLKLDLKENYIKTLQMHFGHGNHTTLTFNDPRRNPLKDDVFELPKGTKVTRAN